MAINSPEEAVSEPSPSDSDEEATGETSVCNWATGENCETVTGVGKAVN